jgi:hypothetical protein
MCGSTSAVGLGERERAMWPVLRERLRVRGLLMGLMRGVLGGDTEVAVVVTTTPAGISSPLAILVTDAIAAELDLLDQDRTAGLCRARIGEDEVDVVVDRMPGEEPQLLAILVTGWMREHLYLYARELWHRRSVTRQ